MSWNKQRSHCKRSCGMCDPGKLEPGTAKPGDCRRMQPEECSGVIPGTFIACGEGGNYCSAECERGEK